MSKLAASKLAARSRFLHPDYYMLDEPRPDGPVIGSYAGRPIAAAVVDYVGRRFVYAGLAPRRRSGEYDLEAIEKGEWIVEPGLLYRLDEETRAEPADPRAKSLGPDLT